MRAIGLGAALAAAALVLSACHTMRFEVGDGPVGKVVHDRKSFFFFGLYPTKHVDVASFCPSGAVAIAEETTFVDGLLGFITLDIYSPRSSTYYCAEDPQ